MFVKLLRKSEEILEFFKIMFLLISINQSAVVESSGLLHISFIWKIPHFLPIVLSLFSQKFSKNSVFSNFFRKPHNCFKFSGKLPNHLTSGKNWLLLNIVISCFQCQIEKKIEKLEMTV